jgi:hypothetical protein
MECGARATLVITGPVSGTSTHVAKQRIELSCKKPKGHDGLHRDPTHAREWQSEPGKVRTLLDHEDLE